MTPSICLPTALLTLMSILLLLPSTTLASTCAREGLDAFKRGGTAAALAAFRRALLKPECAEEPQLQLNYALALLKASAEVDLRSCLAAEYFHRAGIGLSGALGKLAREETPKAEMKCRQFITQAPPNSTDIVVASAETAERGNDLRRAAILFRVATRLEPTAIPPYDGLCRTLPNLGLNGEARAHCQTARTLRAEAVAPAIARSNRVTEWVLTGGAVVLLTAGGFSFVQATSAADEAWDAQNRAREAAAGSDKELLDAALEERSEANEAARNLQFLSWGLVGVGSALGIAAVVGWLGESGPTVGVGPSNVTLRFAW